MIVDEEAVPDESQRLMTSFHKKVTEETRAG